MIKTYIKLIFYPTENYDKLVQVINNIVDISRDAIEVDEKKYYKVLRVEIEGNESLRMIYDGLRKQQIVESARHFLLNKIKDDKVEFLLNKQALFMGKYHFCDRPNESSMGPVWVEIESNNIESVIEYLTPPTKDGKILEVDYVPK
ncbi:MAG: hypothetical protein GF364_01275 [Candidatus Lokiarchaeota archaeon]|nr:hypothetical protein [Candidatus Lokiarchaeota archaeon]